MSADFYDLLGVPKQATKTEIKKAFRDQAKKHHPDKGGDPESFKKINEAYETLSDDQKRAQYDQFGSAGAAGGGGFSGGGFEQGFGGGDFSDLFGDAFSSFFGGRRSSSASSQGEDLECEITISFRESLDGKEQTIETARFDSCSSCESKGGSEPTTCSTCQGSGVSTQKIQTPFGVVAQQVACPSCRGEGKTFREICSACQGEGRIERRQKLAIKIPAGIDHGETLRVRAEGDQGRRGAARGDLYVQIRVTPDKNFKRRGLDLISNLEIPVFSALIGDNFSVKTAWGKGEITIPANTREGELFRLREQGVKRANQTGDHLVRVQYVFPKSLTKEQKESLEEWSKKSK